MVPYWIAEDAIMITIPAEFHIGHIHSLHCTMDENFIIYRFVSIIYLWNFHIYRKPVEKKPTLLDITVNNASESNLYRLVPNH